MFCPQFVYAQFILEGAPHSINCPVTTQQEIFRRLSPPFEELFDSAEEYVLEVLFTAWSEMIISDLSAFGKVTVQTHKSPLSGLGCFFLFSRCATLTKRFSIYKQPVSKKVTRQSVFK